MVPIATAISQLKGPWLYQERPLTDFPLFDWAKGPASGRYKTFVESARPGRGCSRFIPLPAVLPVSSILTDFDLRSLFAWVLLIMALSLVVYPFI
jgi:hypothetical protein